MKVSHSETEYLSVNEMEARGTVQLDGVIVENV